MGTPLQRFEYISFFSMKSIDDKILSRDNENYLVGIAGGFSPILKNVVQLLNKSKEYFCKLSSISTPKTCCENLY